MVGGSQTQRKYVSVLTLEQLLQQNAEFNNEINNGDHVCYTCYREHCVIFKHLQNTVNSTDADLSATLRLKSKRRWLICQRYTQWIKHFYMHPTLVLYVSVMLCYNRLLSSFQMYFCEKSNESIKQHDIVLKQDITTIATPRWLRSQLSALHEHHNYGLPVFC